MATFTKVILFTDTDGRARFREEQVPLGQGTPQSMLSEVFASGDRKSTRLNSSHH